MEMRNATCGPVKSAPLFTGQGLGNLKKAQSERQSNHPLQCGVQAAGFDYQTIIFLHSSLNKLGVIYE